jgi:hypothetical protein
MEKYLKIGSKKNFFLTSQNMVLDNAPTHSKRKKNSIPTQKDNKNNITERLKARNIPIPEKAFKIELLKLVKENCPTLILLMN